LIIKKGAKKINSDLKKEIAKRANQIIDAAKREVIVLEEAAAAVIAEQLGLPVGKIYAAALEDGICPSRYIRNRETISIPEQLKLAQSCVAVIGAGGLGGQIILLLARVGIGRIIVVDHDCFDPTNLNRQALSSVETIGRSKAEQASETVRAINPGVIVDGHQTRIDDSNAENILSGADLVIDALDNISDRFLIEGIAKKIGIPMVHGAVAGLEGQIMTIFPEDEGLKLIYGSGQEERKITESPELIFGVPAVTPALIGTYQVMEAIKIILNKGTIFRNRMVHIDLENGRLHEIKFKD